ncbi:hypothetical protein ACSBR2_002098 [Camellia fascicularis]
MSSGREMKEDSHGWAARDPSGFLSPYKFGRRYCYADVVWTKNKHGDSKYPVVPGYMLHSWRLKEVGSNVHHFKVGDHGGYSSYIVVHERYCFRIPNDLPLALAAPLLCAGITVYSPMIRHKMNQPGKSLGVIGLGGLGHMAVKFGKAFGLSVTVFSTSISKKDEALIKLGADNFVISSDKEQMKVKAMSISPP